MRAGMALVSIAGPLSNLLLAFVCVAVLWLVFASGLVPRFEFQAAVQGLLLRLIFANVGLALFNLLPIPPLDGHRLLPRSLDWLVDFLARYSFVAFLGMIFLAPTILRWPVALIITGLFALFGMDVDLLRALSS
jgi:Zn-dependent protease